MTLVCKGRGDVEEVADMLDVVVHARPPTRGEVAAHDEVMYCQKALLVHSPCRLMFIWSKPCL